MYSVISPLILAFGAFAFALFILVFHYRFYYIAASGSELGSQLLPTALNQLLAGVYMMEAFLIFLFALVRDGGGKAVCIPQAAVMGGALLATLAFQLILRQAFHPHRTYLAIVQPRVRDWNQLRGLEYVLQRGMALLGKLGILNSITPDVELTAALESLVKAEGEQLQRTKKFQRHPSTRDSRPHIEIPKVAGRLSDAEVQRVGNGWKEIGISNRYAEFDEKGRLQLSQQVAELPPLEA